jgi:hypothetical protein
LRYIAQCGISRSPDSPIPRCRPTPTNSLNFSARFVLRSSLSGWLVTALVVVLMFPMALISVLRSERHGDDGKRDDIESRVKVEVDAAADVWRTRKENKRELVVSS